MQITQFLKDFGVRTQDYKFTSIERGKKTFHGEGNQIYHFSQPKTSIVDHGGRSIYVVDFGQANKSVITDNQSKQANYMVILTENENQQITVKSAPKGNNALKQFHTIQMGSASIRLQNKTRMDQIFVVTKQGKLLQTFEQNPVDLGLYQKETFKFI